MVGVTVSVVAIGMTLGLMNRGLEEFPSRQYCHGREQSAHRRLAIFGQVRAPDRACTTAKGPARQPDKPSNQSQGMTLYTSINSPTVPNGYYFLNPQTEKFEIQWIQGIGSERAAAPQAQLMATVINGILQRRLPWGLILLGCSWWWRWSFWASDLFLLPLAFIFPLPPLWPSSAAVLCAGWRSAGPEKRAIRWKRAKSAPVPFIQAMEFFGSQCLPSRT